MALGLPWGASAQVMFSPTAVLGSNLGAFSAQTPLSHLIDQSGVEKPFSSGVTAFDTYFAVPHQTLARNDPDSNWQSEAQFTLPVQGYVDFDLGGSRTISKVGLWSVSAQDVTVRVAEDPSALATAPAAGNFTLINRTAFVFSYGADVLTLASPRRGRYLRLDIGSAHTFSPGDRFAYAILGELVVSAAPETAPTLSITHRADGAIEVTFGGILQSASSLDGPFTDVAGNPQGTHVIPPSGLGSHQFFRAR